MSTLSRYDLRKGDLRKGDLFVLSWTRGATSEGGKVSIQS